MFFCQNTCKNAEKTIIFGMTGWNIYGYNVPQTYSFWKFLLFCVSWGKTGKPSKPREKAESELFRELSLKVLALSGAEICSFWCTISDIFHISQTYLNCQKSRVLQIKMVISQLTKRLEPSMKAPWKAQIMHFYVVWLVSPFYLKIRKIAKTFKKSRFAAHCIHIYSNLS